MTATEPLATCRTSETTVTERPILFSGEMVRALLDGRETQTRRVVKLPEGFKPATAERCDINDWNAGPDEWRFDGATPYLFEGGGATFMRCPYGAPGDRLWVREAMKYDAATHAPDDHIWATYTADGAREEIDGSEVRMCRVKPGKSYPSIHMPRWASRLTLEITEVRVERVQEISRGDALAEGVPDCDGPFRGMTTMPQDGFCLLWESINGSRPGCSWKDNPWVWAVSFRVVPNGEVRQVAP